MITESSQESELEEVQGYQDAKGQSELKA